MADHAATALETGLEQVGGRWGLRIVSVPLDGPRRFGELAAAVPGIAPNLLADRLRRLARAGIVVARPYERRPVRSEDALTADGADLAMVIRVLAEWGARRGGAGEGARHGACGTPVELRPEWCPTCREVVEEPAGSSLEEVHV